MLSGTDDYFFHEFSSLMLSGTDDYFFHEFSSLIIDLNSHTSTVANSFVQVGAVLSSITDNQ